MNISPAAVYRRSKYQFLTIVAVNRVVTGQLADKPTRGQSSRRLVYSRTSQLVEMFDLKCEYIIALSVISDRIHYLYAANI